MAVKTFAAIDVGSYELSMKIFEFSGKGAIREIDHIRYRIELGTDTYNTGKLSYERTDELCRLLREFVDIMKAYQTEDYQAYGTSAIREMENRRIVLDQIRIRTGISIDVLSNSEQRFLDYKSIAFRGQGFNRIIEKATAIVDIGGGSLQISLFDRDSLVTTQNLRLGVLRIRERIGSLQVKPAHFEEIIDEMVESQVEVFKKLYIKDRKIENIIVVDEYISWVLGKKGCHSLESAVDGQEYLEFMEELRGKSREEIATHYHMPVENVQLLFIAALLVRNLMKNMGAGKIWIPGVTLCDGIAYEYAERHRIISPAHDFEKDIIGCAQNIGKRYMGNKKRAETLERIALSIFDSMKKVHGLGKRERLLLRLAALLHDCGKYITLMNVGEASYEIIMSTEIIGLSHVEREIVAHVVRYNYRDFAYYEEQSRESTLDGQSYLTISKLAAILRIATGLDRSHKEKFRDIVSTVRDKNLVIMVDTGEDISLEKGLFAKRAEFFQEVFGITPVIKQRKSF